MSVTYVGEKFPRPTGKSLQEGLYGRRKFQFHTDDPNELEANIYDACPVALGDLFPGTLTAQCCEQTAEQDPESRLDWYVTCQYKSVLNQVEQQRVTTPNPLDRETRISWASRTVMTAQTKILRSNFYRAYKPEVLTSGIPTDGVSFKLFATDSTDVTTHGKPNIGSTCNSANDAYDPVIEVPQTEWIATITKNITAPPTWMETYNDAVNSDAIVIDGLNIAVGCAKLENLRLSEKMKENGTVYRQISFNVIIRSFRPLRMGGAFSYWDWGSESIVATTTPDETVAPEPWDVEVLDEGGRYYDAVNHKWININDKNGVPVAKPVPLMGSFPGFFGYSLETVPGAGSFVVTPEYALSWRLFRPFPRKTFTGVLPLT